MTHKFVLIREGDKHCFIQHEGEPVIIQFQRIDGTNGKFIYIFESDNDAHANVMLDDEQYGKVYQLYSEYVSNQTKGKHREGAKKPEKLKAKKSVKKQGAKK